MVILEANNDLGKGCVDFTPAALGLPRSPVAVNFWSLTAHSKAVAKHARSK